jgi:hypothetical protein
LDTSHHALDVVREARRTEQAAEGEVAQSRTHKPHEATDMIRMSMADEHVRYLMHHPRGQATRLAEIEQKAAAPVAEP